MFESGIVDVGVNEEAAWEMTDVGVTGSPDDATLNKGVAGDPDDVTGSGVAVVDVVTAEPGTTSPGEEEEGVCSTLSCGRTPGLSTDVE